MSPNAIVALAGNELEPAQRARLVDHFGLPLADEATVAAGAAILGRNASGALELRPMDSGVPLTIQFDRLTDRARGARGSPLARALGVGRLVRRVFDATAGLGDDAFALLCAGCEVTLCERLPWLAALLEDALERAGPLPARVLVGDARHHLRVQGERPDAVYLDPMYASPRSGKQKSALPRRAIQVLREFHAAEAASVVPAATGDSDVELLRTALAHAARRVVVKRHPRAEPLGGVRPSGCVRSKLVRFDIYAIPGSTAPA